MGLQAYARSWRAYAGTSVRVDGDEAVQILIFPEFTSTVELCLFLWLWFIAGTTSSRRTRKWIIQLSIGQNGVYFIIQEDL